MISDAKLKMIELSALPAAGKSTYAKAWCEKNKDWVRVNRDDLRHMRGVYWLPKQEKMITEWENACIISALSAGYNVMLDATNLNPKYNKARRDTLIPLFPNLTIERKFFDVPVEECIKRDLKRANSVGEKVIMDMYNKYIKPKTEPVVYSEDKSLPKGVIFDVDGTLAKMEGRSPFDWNKVKEDKLNLPVYELYKMAKASGKKIIIFTGRDGICATKTCEWLIDNNIEFDEFYIRPEGNTEKDSIIKERMFNDHIRGRYYIDFIVDDRDQVIKMWREVIGITALQVDYGNF